MMTLIAAAALAAQPASAVDTHAQQAQHTQMQHGQMTPSQHQQHEGTKKDCCKECCKGMGKHDDHAQPQPKQGQ